MGFRGEIEDRLGVISLQNAGDQRPVANVSADEDIAFVLGKSFEMGRVCRIGEEIQVYHARFGALPLSQDEVAADEARSTGHEMCFHRLPNPIAWGSQVPCRGSSDPVRSLSTKKIAFLTSISAKRRRLPGRLGIVMRVP